jgi:hypothetical protein
VKNISDNFPKDDRCHLSKDYIPALLEGKEQKDSYKIQFCFTELHEAAKGEHCPKSHADELTLKLQIQCNENGDDDVQHSITHMVIWPYQNLMNKTL